MISHFECRLIDVFGVKKSCTSFFLTFSLFTAYNVNSCRKVAQTLKFWNSLISLCNLGSQAQKWQKKKSKNGSLDRDFLKFLHRYDIYWVSRYPCCVLLALSWNTVGHYVNSILQCVLRFQRLLCCVDTHQTVKVQTQIRVNTNTNIIAEKWSYSRVFVMCYKYE